MKLSKVLLQNEGCWVAHLDGKIYRIEGAPYEKIDVTQRECTACMEYLPPCDPTKIIAVAYNYKSLVGERSEYDEPLVFLKGVNSLLPHKKNIVLPHYVEKAWIEIELCVVMRKEGKNISVDEAKDYILGYTIGNDVTALNIYGRDWHLARSKSLDTFCPVGPCIITDIEPYNLDLTSYINNHIAQHGNTNDMILNPVECVSLASKYFTLCTGDIILTGTPANAMNSLIIHGDQVHMQIENIDSLINYVEEEK